MTARRTIPRRAPFDLLGVLQDYLLNRSASERASDAEKKGKAALMDYIEVNGEEEDNSRIVTLDDPQPHVAYKNGKPKRQLVTGIKRQKRTTTSLSEERTMALLKELGLTDECTEVIVVLDEDAVLAANYQGKISDEALKACYDESETFAFYLITEDE